MGTRSQLLLHFLDLEALDDVLLLEIVEALEADAALHALLDLFDVVLEALERRQLAVPDDRAVANETDLGRALDVALGDVRAGDRDALDLEDLADLGLAVHLLDEGRREEAFHGALHVVDGVVDDRVEADLDLVLLGERARLAGRPDVEADDDGLGGDGEVDVALCDGADAGVDDREPDPLARELRERVGDRLDRALDVALDDDSKLLLALVGHALGELLERDLGGGGDEAFRHLAAAALGDL